MAMNAADAAGGEYMDASQSRAHHGGSDGGSTGLTGGEVGGEVAAGDLADIFAAAHQLQFFRGETDFDLAADERHSGGVSAAGPDLFFHLCGKGEVFRIGHTVAEDGAFQGDNGLAVFDGFLQLGGDIKVFFEIHVRCSSCN